MSKIALWIAVVLLSLINSLVLASNATRPHREGEVGVRCDLGFSSHLKAAFWMCLTVCARQIIIPKVLPQISELHC